MADSATPSSGSDRHARIQKSVLTSKHRELREKLNFHSIYPHLNSHGLLPPALDQVELVGELGTSQRKIDKVLAHMPDCGKPDYLDEFINCLKDSNYGTGDAHSELAETIEKAYKSEMDRSVSPEIIGMSVTVVRGGRGSSHLFTGTSGRVLSSINLKRCVCYSAPIATMALIAILTVIFLLSLPRLSNIVYTPNVTASQNVIEVKFESDAAFWIAEASVSVNGCNSSVIVVQGKTCNELPTTEKFHTGHDTKVASGSQIYFLENSYMNLSVINRKNSVVWILNKKDFLESKSGANITEKCDTLHKCPRHDGESCCYRIQDYPEGKIQHQITKPDFYFAVPRPYYFYHTFDVSYSIVAYDPDAIVHLPGAEVFQKSAKISDWFQFDTTKCILLNTTCPITVSGFLPISVANVSKRKDVLVLVLMLEFIVSIVGAGITLLCKLTLLKGKRCPAKRSSTTFEELGPTDATALIESNSSPDKVYVTVSTNSFRSIN